jgi:co-chaperonin GroES (HSP10)
MDISRFEPVNGRLLIEVLPDDSVYDGAIVRLDMGQEKSNLAVVKAVSKVYNEDAPAIPVGATVLFNKHSGSIIRLDRFDDNSPEYRVIKTQDILGLIHDCP